MNSYITGASSSGVAGLAEWAAAAEPACEAVESHARCAAASHTFDGQYCAELLEPHADNLSRAVRWAVAYTNAREGPLPSGVRLRVASASPSDVSAMHRFVAELADFEGEPHEVRTTPATFLRDGFGPSRQFHCVFAEEPVDGAQADGCPWSSYSPIAMALAHASYSTWHGPTIYVEDVYVTPVGRRRGVGERLFLCWARAAHAAQAQRLQWSCLDWNKGAIALYESRLRAEPLKDWTLYRLYADGIKRLAYSATNSTASQ